jgi:hypothetical protein
MLAMTGGYTFSLLWLGLAVLLTGMAALARARSVSPAPVRADRTEEVSVRDAGA